MPGILNAVKTATGLTPVGMGLSAVSLAGQAFGMAKAAKEQKANQDLLNAQNEQNQAEYNNEANKSFLDTNVAKDAVKVAKENLIDNQKQVEGNAAITGASDEAKVAGQSNVNKNYNDSVSRIASMATGYQDRAKNRFQATRMALQGQQANLNQQKAEGAANLASNAGDLLGTVTMNAGMNDGNKSENSTMLSKRESSGNGVKLNNIAKSTPVNIPNKPYSASYWNGGTPNADIQKRQGN